ncbi:MAG: DUF4129 domain-containing protein [Acidimicrobiia bacterium]|nr:DUF4129 domain-containing protein [Acidimicrobiia bacterium]
MVGCEDTTPPRPPDLPDGPGAPALTVPGFLNVLIIGVLGAALAVGLFLAVRAIIRNRKGEDTADEEGDGDGVEITAGSTRRLRPKSAADWAQLAREAAQAGEWDRALRYMHRSGILRLDEEGHVRYRRGRTNGEYALLLSTRSPRAAGTLRSLSRTVEDVQFGEQPASGDMFESAEAGWAELERTLDVPTADAFETTAGRPA